MLDWIDVEIPRATFTVITGLSGSLSPYARQFLDQMERPEVDSIDALSPAITIEVVIDGLLVRPGIDKRWEPRSRPPPSSPAAWC